MSYVMAMPTIKRFPRFELRMYFGDHPPAHVHMTGRGYEALIAIEDGTVLRGAAPRRELGEARIWIEANRASLMGEWRRKP